MKGMIAMTKREKNLVPLFEERRDTTSGIQKYNKILIFVPIIVILIAILSIVVVAKTDESTLGIKVSDKDTNINLENAKFTVKKVVNGEEEDAKDVEGNFVGSVENIDGNDYRIVSTNSNGEINLSLPSGTYKVTQISAPEGYELNEENTYEVTLTSNGTYNLNYLNKEWEKNFEKDVLSSDIKATQGEEYLSLILSRKNTNIPAEETSFNSEVLLEENKAYIFRYNKDNKISEVVNLKLDEQSRNFINDLKEDNTKSNKVRNDSGMITIKIVKETDNYYIIRGGDSYIWFDKTGNLLKYLRLYPEGSYISAYTDFIETNDGFIVYIDTIDELKIPVEFSSENKETILPANTTSIIEFTSDGIIKNINQYNDLYIDKIVKNENGNEFSIATALIKDMIIPAENTTNNEEISLTSGYYLIQYNNFKISNYKKLDIMEELEKNNAGTLLILTNKNESLVLIDGFYQNKIDAKYTENNTEINLEEGYYIAKINNNGKIINITNKIMTSLPVAYQIGNKYATYSILSENISAEETAEGKEIEIDGTALYEVVYNEELKVVRARKIANGDMISSLLSIKVPVKIITLDNDKLVYLNFSFSLINGYEASTPINNIKTSLEKYQEKERIAEEIEKKDLKITNAIWPTLEIIKQDKETGNNLPGAKFAIRKVITNSDGSKIEEDATDIYGNIVGTKENINGEELYVSTTDENGKIYVKLAEGTYKIKEVQAPEGYKLDENNEQEIEITTKETYSIKSASILYKKNYGDLQIHSIETIGNSGYIMLADIVNYDEIYTVKAEETVDNKEIVLTGENSYLIKYNNENKVEKALTVAKGTYSIIVKANQNNTVLMGFKRLSLIDDDGNITDVFDKSSFEYPLADNANSIKTSNNGKTDEGFVIWGYTEEEKTIPADKTVKNEEITVSGDVIFILNDSGKVVNAISINEGLIFINVQRNGEFTVYTKNGNVCTYDKTGTLKENIVMNIEWFINNTDTMMPIDFYATKDSSLMISLYTNEEVKIEGKYTVSGEDITIPTGPIMLNVTKEGKINFNAQNAMYTIGEVNNGYLVYLAGNSEIDGSQTENGRPIKNDSMIAIAKLNKLGKIEYINELSSLSMQNLGVTKVIDLEDGKYMIATMEDEIRPVAASANMNLKGIVIQTPDTLTIYNEETTNIKTYNKQTINVTNEANVGTVIVRYLDKETNEEVLPTKTMKQNIGVEYKTTGKEVQYYKLDGTPENAEGVVTPGVTEVIYYYEKQNFNIQTDKTISKLYVNGEEQKLSDTNKNIFQISIHRKDIPTAELKIKYTIVITNSGEIPGTAGKVTDMIPEGLIFYEEDNEDHWYLENGYAVTNILDGVELAPGESRELEIVLRCEEVGENMGLKTNRAVAENTKNGANFAETTTEDNESGCRLIVAETLGLEDYLIETLKIVLAVLIVAGGILITLKIKERRK